MIPELAILPALLKRETYDIYRGSVNLGNAKQNMRQIYGVYLTLDKLMESVPNQAEFSLAEFEAYYWQQHPMMKGDEREILQDTLWAVLPGVPVTPAIERLLHEANNRALAADAAMAAFKVSTGEADPATLLEVLQRVQQGQENPASAVEFVTDDLNVILDQTVGRGGLTSCLPSLDRRRGPLRRGHLGVVFGRPEVGKTTYLAHEAVHTAQIQTDSPVLWFGNEEAGESIKLRCFQSALGRDINWIIANRERALEEYLNITGGRVKLIDRAHLTASFVEGVLRTVKPALVIIDKLDHVKGFDAERTDLKLGSIYRWAREVAKEWAPVVGVCHADGAAEGMRWLTMEHMDNAKTSKQETADWILGIGQQHADGMEYVRYLHLSKNKISGGPETDPALRHDKWEVIIQPEIARYTDTPRAK